MSADELRKAADMLRDLTEGLASQAKWEMASTDDGSLVNIFPADSDSALLATDVDTATYIATMHPGVGLALADWLDYTFDQGHSGDMDDNGCDECAPALAVARLINGEAA